MEKNKIYLQPTDATLDEMKGTLPNLFQMEDGTRVTNKDEWKKRRQELSQQVVQIAYGGIPPKPEVFEVEKLSVNAYRITAGTKEQTVGFEMQLFMPEGEEKHPVLLTGDAVAYCHDDIVEMFRSQGFVVARFNRGALAGEWTNFKREQGLYPVYPDLRFGTIAAWAWGYHRCIDALEQMDFIDKECICITGHSRGGKASLLAAATDERIAYTHSSGSGMLGCGCIRYTQKENPELIEPNQDCHSEVLGNMFGREVGYNIGFWFGEELEAYIGREEELPFDLHALKALVAPRGLLETDSVDDIWANPRGSYHTFRAAREVYQFLGVPEKIASVYRYGVHGSLSEDFYAFLNFIKAMRSGRPFLQANADTIFKELPLIYNWKSSDITEMKN